MSEQVQIYEKQALLLIDHARVLVITDQASREEAVSFRSGVNIAEKNIVNFFKPMKEKAHATWKEICGQENKLTTKLNEAKRIIDNEIGRDYMEQKRNREEAEKKAAVAATEQERLIRERLESQAMKSMDKGNFDKAEVILQQAEEVFVPVITAEPEAQKTIKVDGSTTSVIEDIDVEVSDARVFCGAVATNRFPVHLIEIKLGEVKRYIKAMGITEMAGIKITKTARVSGRAS